MNHQFSMGGLPDRRIVKFLSIGMLNTVFGYSVYTVLIFVNVPYLIALFVATVAGITFNYFSFSRMVIHVHVGWFVFVKFVIAYGVIYVANAALLRALTKDFLFNLFMGQVIFTPLSLRLRWLLMNYWVYKKA